MHQINLLFFLILLGACTTTKNRNQSKVTLTEQDQWSCVKSGNFWQNNQCYLVSRHTKFFGCDSGQGLWSESEKFCGCKEGKIFDWQRRTCVPDKYFSLQKDHEQWKKNFSSEEHCLYGNGEWRNKVCYCPVGTVWNEEKLNCISTIGYQYDCPGKFQQDYCYTKSGENLVYNIHFGWVSSNIFLQNPNMGLVEADGLALTPVFNK